MSQARLEFSLVDESATDALGAALACAYEACGRGRGTVYLRGDLGTGKTTCVRRLLQTLGIQGSIRSPTYTLVEEYESRGVTALHVDLYRLQGTVEVDELGLRDYLMGDCLLLVEWPERGGRALPPADLVVALAYEGDGRRANLSAESSRGVSWLEFLSRDNSISPYVSNLT